MLIHCNLHLHKIVVKLIKLKFYLITTIQYMVAAIIYKCCYLDFSFSIYKRTYNKLHLLLGDYIFPHLLYLPKCCIHSNQNNFLSK